MVKSSKELALHFAPKLTNGKIGALLSKETLKAEGSWDSKHCERNIGNFLGDIRSILSQKNLGLKYRRAEDAYEVIALDTVKRKNQTKAIKAKTVAKKADNSGNQRSVEFIESAAIINFGDFILVKSESESFLAKRVDLKAA
jgi:hypothetical protein